MRRHGLPESIAIQGAPEPPKDSWWISDGTRQGFREAHQRQLDRLTGTKVWVPGQNRVVDNIKRAK